MAKSQKKPFHLIKWLNRFSTERTAVYGMQYQEFAIFCLFNFTLPYFMWSQANPLDPIILFLRIVGGMLCFLTLLRHAWPQKLQTFLPLYWHFTLFYCLPFFNTYMLLENRVSLGWFLNTVLSLFLLLLLVDWLTFIIVLPLGVALGIGAYLLVGTPHSFLIDYNLLSLAAYMFVFTVAIGLIFSRNRQLLDEEKLSSFKLIGGIIAHEMRTPLLTIKNASQALKKIFLKKSKSDFFSQKETLVNSELEKLRIQGANIVEVINSTMQDTLLLIDMLLMKMRESLDNQPLENCSMQECIGKVLEEYPLTSEEREIIYWDQSANFYFHCNMLFIKHVLFNLLKNALYAIKEVDRGTISIWCENNRAGHTLHFKDTAKGIAAIQLPYIFDRFYTKNRYGTGIGLAFCKMVMESIGGEISCASEEGSYTEFTLIFPKQERPS